MVNDKRATVLVNSASSSDEVSSQEEMKQLVTGCGYRGGEIFEGCERAARLTPRHPSPRSAQQAPRCQMR